MAQSPMSRVPHYALFAASGRHAGATLDQLAVGPAELAPRSSRLSQMPSQRKTSTCQSSCCTCDDASTVGSFEAAAAQSNLGEDGAHTRQECEACPGCTWDANCVSQPRCCCITRLCFVKGAVQKTYYSLVSKRDEQVPPGMVSVPFMMLVEYEDLAKAGGDCGFDWLETNKSGTTPGGYKPWLHGTWNSYKQNPQVADHFDRQWQFSTPSQLPDAKPGRRMRGEPDHLMLRAGDDFLIFVRVSSGCSAQEQQCLDCCALLRISANAGATDIDYEVVGSCGSACDVNPDLRGKSTRDVLEDFAVRAGHLTWMRGRPPAPRWVPQTIRAMPSGEKVCFS
jgi:hypothetical protein